MLKFPFSIIMKVYARSCMSDSWAAAVTSWYSFWHIDRGCYPCR